jgi:hypothetical protein
MGVDAAANQSVLAGMNGDSSYNSGKWGAVISLFVFTCGWKNPSAAEITFGFPNSHVCLEHWQITLVHSIEAFSRWSLLKRNIDGT